MAVWMSPNLPAELSEAEQRLAEKRRKLEEPTEEKAELAPLRKEAVKLLAQYEKKVCEAELRVEKIKAVVEELMLVSNLPRRILDLFGEFERVKLGGGAMFSSVIYRIDGLTKYQVFQGEHRQFQALFNGACTNFGAIDRIVRDLEAALPVFRKLAKGG